MKISPGKNLEEYLDIEKVDVGKDGIPNAANHVNKEREVWLLMLGLGLLRTLFGQATCLWRLMVSVSECLGCINDEKQIEQDEDNTG